MTNKPHHWHYTGDVSPESYGGKWYRRVARGIYQFIELANMDDACGRDNEGHDTYVVELSLVDLNEIPASEQDSAWRSCGWDDSEFTPTHDGHEIDNEDRNERTAIACYEYGLKAPLESWSGNAYGKLLRAARSEAHRMRRDANALDEALAKPVNKIGSTAREFMVGDITSAVFRGVMEGRPEAELMLKLGVGSKGGKS